MSMQLPGQPYDHPPDIFMDNCPKCHQRVGYHCAACKEQGNQMTGCACTLEPVIKEIRAQQERERLARLGLIDPAQVFKHRYCPKGGQHLVVNGTCLRCMESIN